MCGCGSKKPKPPVKPTGRIFLTIFLLTILASCTFNPHKTLRGFFSNKDTINTVPDTVFLDSLMKDAAKNDSLNIKVDTSNGN